MGHSDRIVIADGNFPAESMGRDAHVIHMEGHGVPEILEAILSLFPLDTYTCLLYTSKYLGDIPAILDNSFSVMVCP